MGLLCAILSMLYAMQGATYQTSMILGWAFNSVTGAIVALLRWIMFSMHSGSVQQALPKCPLQHGCREDC